MMNLKTTIFMSLVMVSTLAKADIGKKLTIINSSYPNDFTVVSCKELDCQSIEVNGVLDFHGSSQDSWGRYYYTNQHQVTSLTFTADLLQNAARQEIGRVQTQPRNINEDYGSAKDVDAAREKKTAIKLISLLKGDEETLKLRHTAYLKFISAISESPILQGK